MGVNGIYGLSGSGIDVESMVKAGMLTKQNEYDKMYKKETKNEWIKSAYSDIYSSMTTFKYTTISKYKMQSTMNAMKASSTDTASVSASANGAAAAMTHKVEVTGLSSNAYMVSASAISRNNIADTAKSSINLQDIVFASVPTGVKSTDVAISFTVAGTSDTLTDEQKKKQTISYTYGDLANGKTLNDLAADINALGVNVQASYDSTQDRFSLYNKAGGKSNIISITAAAADSGGTNAATLFNNLNLKQSKNGETTSINAFAAAGTVSVAGDNGSVKVDGVEYNNITDNKITVAGVTYTLLNKTSSAATVTVTQDTDSVISSVKQFVEDYNKMLDSLNSKIYETQYADYQPLTKSQEASMSQTQIDKWNEKAKSGLLYNSSILKGIVSSMREALYTPVDSVESSYNSASAIGITSSTNKGHITLDEDKLKKALAADPDCVYQIFASEQDDYYYATGNKKNELTQKSDFRNTGIANRLYFTSLTEGLSSISDYAGTTSSTSDQSSLGKLITNLQTKMSTFKTQMSAYETLLYKKYDAMETAIANLSAQLKTVSGSNS